jgi:hypothetical protein
MAEGPDIRWLGLGLAAVFMYFTLSDLGGIGTNPSQEPVITRKEIPSPKFNKFMGPTIKVLYCFS